MSRERDFTPALGHALLTPLYDSAIAVTTREGRWRAALVAQIRPRAGDVILDVGCGTGSLAVFLKKAAPAATMIGLDPDADVLDRARAKAARANVDVEFVQGFAADAARFSSRRVTKVVSSLVFHQTPLAEKEAGLRAMFEALQPNGAMHIADYGLQRTPLMRALFRQVQRLDGFENTTPNAEGILPALMVKAGFEAVQETAVIPTPNGSISLYRGDRAATAG